MSIDSFLLWFCILIQQLTLSIQETPENKNRLLFALLVNFIIGMILFIRVTKEMLQDWGIIKKDNK